MVELPIVGSALAGPPRLITTVFGIIDLDGFFFNTTKNGEIIAIVTQDRPFILFWIFDWRGK